MTTMRILQLPLLVIVVVAAIATFSPASCAASAARADDDVSTIVRGALESASSLPGARVELVSMERRPDACAVGAEPRAEVPQPVDGSGKFAVKLVGTRSGGAAPCQAWVWARVRVFATVSVATRTIRAGEPFAGATNTDEREIRPGRLPATALEGATAERTVGVGQMVEADVVRQPGLRPGDPVKVVIVAGAMSIEQTGRAVACARNHNCAVLPSGRHVDGALVAGRLLVEMP
jgi:hypothetical protein